MVQAEASPYSVDRLIATPAQSVIWSIIGLMVVGDIVLLRYDGIAVPWSDFALIGAGVIALIAIAAVNAQRNPHASTFAIFAAQFLAAPFAGGVLTYAIIGATSAPLFDAQLAAIDSRLGFDWLAWFQFVAAHRWLKMVLALGYFSMVPQVVLLALFLSWSKPHRVEEFTLAAILAMAICAASLAIFPALSAFAHYGIAVPQPWAKDILMLRAHNLAAISRLEGIVTIPSYHTILGVLFVYAVRDKWWIYPAAAVNVLLIVSVISEGSHYLADPLAGLGVAIVSIAVARNLKGYGNGAVYRVG